MTEKVGAYKFLKQVLEDGSRVVTLAEAYAYALLMLRAMLVLDTTRSLCL